MKTNKYSEILPQNDTVEVYDNTLQSCDENFCSEGNNLSSREQINDENDDNMKGQEIEKPKLYMANKYIGVYQGKFGILTKKTEVETKNKMKKKHFEQQMKLKSSKESIKS